MKHPSLVTEWVRNFRVQLSPESRLGSLRGAHRDGVLLDVLKTLDAVESVKLIELLHQDNIDLVRGYKETEAFR